ncbi:MAG: alpha/beta fold hydrolase [Gemmatimonadaceae bacterium]|nr:alpha/beta fold hydrolase [Gemmatimonadaceae bacterium]
MPTAGLPPITAPRANGYTAKTPVPLYWAGYGPQGVSPLLVLHGGPGASHDYLLPQMLELARDRELILYDQRGGGRSRQDDAGPVTWRTQVEDLVAVVKEFALEPLSIVGYSWGGLLAMLYAVEAAAGRVSVRPGRMVLIDPAPATRRHREEFETEFNKRQQSDRIRSMREQLAASGLQEMDREAYRQRAFELSVAGYFADPAQAARLTPFRVIGKVQKSIWESLGDYDLLAALGTVKCPALVVHGSEDPIPAESSREIAAALGARFVLLEGSGHVPYVESPDQLFPALVDFLDDTDA